MYSSNKVNKEGEQADILISEFAYAKEVIKITITSSLLKNKRYIKTRMLWKMN